jgi:hypothetical protein
VVTAARERLAEILGRDGGSAAFCVQLTAGMDELRLAVDGIGRVQFPVPAQQARKLCELGRPARFGRGEETVTDLEVRDTWEIPRSLVRAEWGGAFGRILGEVREKLGLPPGCELTADFQSMLAYAPGQFFAAHQDSEKDDTMIGTLVVTLPSVYSGGELRIGHGSEYAACRGSDTELTLVAFYADRRHEIRPVTSGYRITLTYNLLLTGGTSEPAADGETIVGELAGCLGDHFSTPVRAGCEAVLALAAVVEQWLAFEPEPVSGPEDWQDEGGDAYREYHGDYDLEDLLSSGVELTRWANPAGSSPEEISLQVCADEVCATMPSVGLMPYASQYTGWMGNHGNTMDRWYRRAALVVSPRDRSFASRAEALPTWALDELSTRVRAGDLDGARATAATLGPYWALAPFWGEREFPPRTDPGLLGAALRTAIALDEAELAGMLLRPFCFKGLRSAHAAALVALVDRYGQQWTDELLQTWLGNIWCAPWFDDGNERPPWVVASMPELCQALQAEAGGTAIAHRLLNLLAGKLAR